MSTSISAALPMTDLLPVQAVQPVASVAKLPQRPQPAPTVATPQSNLSADTSALDRVLGGYRAGVAEGEPVAALSSLARQITTDAQLLAEAAQPAAPPTDVATPAKAYADTSSAVAHANDSHTGPGHISTEL